MEIDTEEIINTIANMSRATGKEINHTVALWIVQNFEFRCVIGTSKKDPMYVYKDGIFVEGGDLVISSLCEEILGCKADNNSVNQICEKVRRLRPFEREDLGCKNLDLICLKDCVLNFRTGEILEHGSEFGFMSKLPMCYDKEADCEKFKEYLSEAMYKEDLDTCQEWFGFCLYRDYFEKTSLVLIGPKDSGKTVLLNMMGEFVGMGNVSSVDLHDMIDNRFATNGLFGKMLNTNDELDGSDLKNTTLYKRLVGKSKISAEAKGQTPYNFENEAKIVFATNQMPLPSKLTDPSSYYNKFITFEFDNVFSKDDPNTDKFLMDKLRSPEELSGILNWALVGLKRLLDNKRFSKCEYWRTVEAVMKRTGRDIAQFESQCCKFEEMAFVGKEEMYKAYCDFCKLNDKIVEYDILEFGRKFKPGYVKNVNNQGKKYNGWRHVSIDYGNILKI